MKMVNTLTSPSARLVMQRLLEIASRQPTGVSHHYEEYWRIHDECALRAANDAMARLLASEAGVVQQLKTAQAEIERLKAAHARLRASISMDLDEGGRNAFWSCPVCHNQTSANGGRTAELLEHADDCPLKYPDGAEPQP